MQLLQWQGLGLVIKTCICIEPNNKDCEVFDGQNISSQSSSASPPGRTDDWGAGSPGSPPAGGREETQHRGVGCWRREILRPTSRSGQVPHHQAGQAGEGSQAGDGAGAL